MKEKKDKLIILDYNDGRAYVYYIIGLTTESDIQIFMLKKGHQPNNCSWMITTEKIIII